jgi:small conductance mechanosensitive channel
MSILKTIYGFLQPGLPLAAALIIGIPILSLFRNFMDKRYEGQTDKGLRIQVIMLLLSFVLLVMVIIVAPINDNQKGQILSLLGIVLSAAIALSSTTFVGNIMAGLMMRAVKGFRVGDFIICGEDSGRVSERGLFHIEIQTENRDLITLPNLHLVSNPVKVIRSSGTIMSTTVSLGYDTPRAYIKAALLKAAETAGLVEPYVHVAELGDFSVTYRISGLLTDTKMLISSRSRIRECVLDELHGSGIEIVSPNFMNTRQLDINTKIIPKTVKIRAADTPETTPEDLVFDKAEEAESIDQMRNRFLAMGEEVESLEASLKDADDDQKRSSIQARIETLQRIRTLLGEKLEQDKETSPDH